MNGTENKETRKRNKYLTNGNLIITEWKVTEDGWSLGHDVCHQSVSHQVELRPHRHWGDIGNNFDEQQETTDDQPVS